MNYFWENATKQIINELSDPLLRVEFNSDLQIYEIYKWIPHKAYITIPGSLVGLNSDTVYLSYESGRHALQTTCKTWDNRIIESLLKGRPGRRTAKEEIQNLKVINQKIENDKKQEAREQDKDAILDMHKLLRPTIYSYSKN
jgi:hypothetical protein